MGSFLRLFQIGQRGVDIVNKPQDLDESEVVLAQNAEVASDGGGALDQRSGMTRITVAPVNGGMPITAAIDVPVTLTSELSPTLYAGLYAGSTHNWRKTIDGATWTDSDALTKPFSNIANVSYYKNFPKCVTVGRYLYWVDASMNVRQWDGTTDSIVSAIPLLTVRPVMPPLNASVTQQGTPGVTSYTYVLVPILGGSIFGPSLTLSTATGNATLTGSNFNRITTSTASSVQFIDVTAIDVYRTVGGATQGKIGTIQYAPGFSVQHLDDTGLVGDAASVPSATSTVAVVSVLDMITDGTSIYLLTLDTTTDPREVGRLLSLNPMTAQWTQITMFEGRIGVATTGQFTGLPWGNGTGSCVSLIDAGVAFGTYIGSTTGNTSYIAGFGSIDFAGGIPDVKTNATNVVPCSMAIFNGDLYFGCAFNAAGTAAAVIKRTGNESAITYATVESGPATAALNAFTSLWTFNSKLYAGWTSGGGATAARIQSTADGTSWTTEVTLNATEVVCQAVTFKNTLYVVLGKTGVAYNTATRVMQSTTGGVWTEVDNPSDDFAGCLGIVYS